MKDKTINCIDCKQDFEFTVNEQEFYKEKGFTNEPKRCPSCRKAKKEQSRGNNRSNNNFGTRRY